MRCLLRSSCGMSMLFLASILLLLTGCGDVVGGGTDKSGSIFVVGGVTPTYLGENTHDVDIVMDLCDQDEVEPFTDHSADVQLINRPLPNATEQTASTIYLDSYRIQYIPDSPAPSIASLSVDETMEIPPCAVGSDCSGTTFSATFVNLLQKGFLEGYYEDQGWDYSDPNYQRTYNIEYTFYGANEFGEPVSAKASTNFTVLDYDNCP